MRHSFARYATALGVIVAFGAALGLADERPRDLDKVPRQVMQALKAKFPKAEINKWSKETENGSVVYDMEFEQNDRKFEADIKEDGAIDNWEKQIPARDLPDAVKKALNSKYPKATLKEVMATTLVRNGADVPEGYEVLFETAGNKEVEVTLTPDGKFLEGPGEKE
jgi:Putative beta-lactamase-inhibitor-like, PepSY-like